MLDYAWIIPALPAVSFLLILFFGKRMPLRGAEIGIGAVGASFLLSVVAVFQWIDRVDNATGHSKGLGALGRSVFAGPAHEAEPVVQPVVHSITWWQNGLIKFDLGTRVDGLVVMMLFVVALISLLVHIYSVAYMREEVRFTSTTRCSASSPRRCSCSSSPTTHSLMLVGWEGVGLCSFALIGHFWEEKRELGCRLESVLHDPNRRHRADDRHHHHVLRRGDVQHHGYNEYALSKGADHSLLLAGAICLFIGIIGKSGQFPLHTWLPDAMAGPTPVSALIHAATMVVAGVYLGARLYPVFFEGFSIAAGGVNFMALIGGITIIIGAMLAFVQRDIKKVLAYSTISQIGYMVMALGVGAWTAAVFHLFTHAFFKALLFLGAGSVSFSGSHHSFDMKSDMGGLRKPMPITFWTFIIGSLALAGIFPFAGFWSKDEILVTAGESGFDAFLVVGLVGAFLTAAYMTRCIYLTFFGEYRGHGHPHESEPLITVPLMILAFFSVVAGLINAAPLGIEKFKEWVEPTVAFPLLVHADFDYPKAIISVTVAVLGIGIAAYFWFQREEHGPLKGLTQRNALARAGYTFLEKKYYLDVLYENIIVERHQGPDRPRRVLVRSARDRQVRRMHSVRGARRLGIFTYDVIDQKVVDGAVNQIAEVTGETGGLLRYIQSGRVQRYALLLFAAVGLLSLALLIANI